MGERTAVPFERKWIISSASRERFLPLNWEGAQPLTGRGVRMAGISDLRPPYEICRPDPRHHQLLYTLDGRGAWRTETDAGELTPGTLWWTPAGPPVHYWIDGDRWEIFWFLIGDTERWRRLRGQPARLVAPGAGRRMLTLMELFIAESVTRLADSALAARSLAEALGIYLDRRLASDRSPRRARIEGELRRLWESVMGDLARPWTIERLAVEMRVSTTQLHRAVAECHQTTPMKMIERFRMQRAEELLLHTDQPVYLVASQVGYATPFAFSKAFRRHAGLSPRVLRRRADGGGGRNMPGLD